MLKYLNVKMIERGVSLYLGLMIMTILLAIGLGISTIIVSQMRMIRGMGDSVVAFFAADTGIEKVLYDDKQCYQTGCLSPPCTATCLGLPDGYTTSDSWPNNTSYNASFSIQVILPGIGECPATASSCNLYRIQSAGNYKEARRAIEVSRLEIIP